MNTIITKKIDERENTVVIPRQEYEELLRHRLTQIKEVELTPRQKKHLKKSRENLAKGKTITLHELKRKLGIGN